MAFIGLKSDSIIAFCLRMTNMIVAKILYGILAVMKKNTTFAQK